MSKYITLLLVCLLLSHANLAQAQRYGEQLCDKAQYHCIKIIRGQSWESLWSDPEQRDIVKRLNRLNIRLRPGMHIAVPNNLANLTIYDVAPFPRYINPPGEKIIYVDQQQLAFGAYTADGELAWWGPISSGKEFCKDVGESCDTPAGNFHAYRKQGIDCVSGIFPRRANGVNGGAIMPFCIYFNGGIALHGSQDVPGYRASHGCVRIFIEDAKWLNEEFIEMPGENGGEGTTVVVNNVETT